VGLAVAREFREAAPPTSSHGRWLSTRATCGCGSTAAARSQPMATG